MKKLGFTLIELLIVISIIGILAALLATNFVAARSRAYDAKGKTDLSQLKSALHSYYANYHQYPPNNSPPGYGFKGCYAGGINLCGTSFTADSVEYLSKLPSSFNYYSCSSGDDFRLKVTLSNKSDTDIAQSKLACPASSCGLSPYGPTDFVVCGSQ